MDINTNIEYFNYPSYQNPEVYLKCIRSKTKNGVTIISPDVYLPLYDEFNNTGNYSIIDYQSIPEFDMSIYTKYAIELLPKTENIVVSYPTEALNSTYWNVIFEILQSAGFKNVLWIDGGLTSGEIFRHVYHLNIVHFYSDFFFSTLFRPMVVDNMPAPGIIGNRNKHFICLSRLLRFERLYFIEKLLSDKNLFNKGIVSCGWGDSTMHVYKNSDMLKKYISEETISQLPLSLGHKDDDQHKFHDEFSSAIFNVVHESSVGYDSRSHKKQYDGADGAWLSVISDRIFFTEKSAKPFLMNQIPLFIAAPGMVEVLRNLGFDLFDDIVDHSYDKEDNINKRCDLVFNELKRLVSMHTVEGWTNILKRKSIFKRFEHNHNVMKTISVHHNKKIYTWITENF